MHILKVRVLIPIKSGSRFIKKKRTFTWNTKINLKIITIYSKIEISTWSFKKNNVFFDERVKIVNSFKIPFFI